METLEILGRSKKLFDEDISINEKIITEIINDSSFLVLGGAGSIGQAVTKEIFRRNPRKIHVVDISENNLVELVRDLRSSYGYIVGEFKTFALDIGSWQFDSFLDKQREYDFILNLSALKHVRSEKDPYTLMRMIEVNILNTIKTIRKGKELGVKKYFCVSTDKAANPVNMMGGSKRIMEMFLFKESEDIEISTARFANVAFSDGSLLHGFNQRISKGQPIAAPNDIKRYFVTPQESGELCMMSTILGKNRNIFFPKLDGEIHLTKFSDIAQRYLHSLGLQSEICGTEDEARHKALHWVKGNPWPCYFSNSNTTGEKSFEEFYTKDEELDLKTFKDLGVVLNGLNPSDRLEYFLETIESWKNQGYWEKDSIVQLFKEMIPNFGHIEKGLYLDSKM